MKGKLRTVSTGLIAVLALAIVVTGVARSHQGFFPFDTDRELNSNQILFPDGGSAAGDDEQSGGDDSYWQQDDADDMTGQNGSNTGYLFGQGQQAPGGTGTVTTGTGAGSTSSSGSGNGDNVYELTDRPSSEGDLILPGGGGGNAPSGGTVPGGNGTGNGGGNGGTGGENGGNLTPGGDTPSGPVPGYGSSSKDELNTDYVRPSYAGKGDEKFDDSTSDRLEKSGNYEVRISKASSANQASGEALYRGQQQVDAAAIFQSIEAFVWDHDSDLNFYWTLDDLCVNGEDDSKSYIKINGIALGENPTETVTEFPVDIPADEDYITIYVSYRFSLGDEWTSYIREDFLGPTPGVSYELYNSKVTLLDKVLTKEGETISRDSIVNLYGQYIDVWTDYVNLYTYQNKIVGGKTTKVTELFPGWTEDGKSVPFIYSPTVGRHVPEPGNRVALDDAYQVEVFTHWIKSNYEVSANTEVDYGASYAYLQTLTNYNGSDKADDHVYRLTVPQYIQAVEFVYHMGMTVNYIDLPSSVIYIDTNGIPSIDDDWLLYII